MSRKLLLLGCLVCLIGLLAGCGPSGGTTITGSGNVVTREEQITGFEKLESGWAFHLEITQGETFKVLVRVDDNLLEHVQVSKESGTLFVGLKEDSRQLNIKDATLEATITMPALTGLELSGASRANISGFESTSSFDVVLSGASRLSGEIDCGDATFEASGASHVRLVGTGENLRIDASGASNGDLDDFEGVDVVVVASGGSTVTVFASGRLDAEASGASDVFYRGGPTLGSIQASGGSSIDPR
jgi:hypothetical protein